MEASTPGPTAWMLRDPAGFLDDANPARRRLAVALAAAAPLDRLAAMLAGDPDPYVRAAAAEALPRFGQEALGVLLTAVDDDAAVVQEAACFALGEIGDPAAVERLMTVAGGHGDKLVREGAVAALGAIGDERAVPLLLDLVASGPPQVRRRCVVALTAFDGDEVEAAIRAAAGDRNPMVREAAEMVVGRPGAGRGCC